MIPLVYVFVEDLIFADDEKQGDQIEAISDDFQMGIACVKAGEDMPAEDGCQNQDQPCQSGSFPFQKNSR